MCIDRRFDLRVRHPATADEDPRIAGKDDELVARDCHDIWLLRGPAVSDQRRGDHTCGAVLGGGMADERQRLSRVRDLVDDRDDPAGDRRRQRNPPDRMLERDLFVDAPADPDHAQLTTESGGDHEGREEACASDPHHQLGYGVLERLGQIPRERCDLLPRKGGARRGGSRSRTVAGRSLSGPQPGSLPASGTTQTLPRHHGLAPGGHVDRSHHSHATRSAIVLSTAVKMLAPTRSGATWSSKYCSLERVTASSRGRSASHSRISAGMLS